MLDTVYHFKSILGAAPSEDGHSVQLDVMSAAGQCGLLLPTREIPSAILSIFTAWGAATAISGDKVKRTFELRKLGVYQEPGSKNVELLITLHSDAPPLRFGITQEQLVQMAIGILETQGLVVSEKPSQTQ